LIDAGPRRRPNPVWLGLGIVGWVGLVVLAGSMWNANPRAAGFDLELLLRAGRAVAEGQSPYDPSLVAGNAPAATDLFYSYPPPVAQAMSLFAAVPSAVMFAALWIVAVLGLAVGTRVVARRFAPDLGGSAAILPVVAVAPLFLPFAVALLFGNLDALFPFVYAVVLVGAVVPVGAARPRVIAGVALAAATVAKVHPGGLGLWFVGRAAREWREGRRSGGAAVVVVSAAVAALAIVVLSIALGGLDLWRDYLPVASAASNARLLDQLNAGPAAQLALLLGGDEALVRTIHLPVAIVAVVAALAAGAFVRDALTGVAIAAVASLVVLPVTWYHYPVALIPFGVAAILRARGTSAANRTTMLVAAAGIVATLSIAWVPGVWVAIALGLAAVFVSASASET